MKYLLLILLIVLTGCGGNSGGDPAQTVEDYLTAKVAGDDEQISKLLCSEKEADFEQEAASFDSVEARIEGMSCQRDGDIVRCEGTIIAVYGGEDTEFPLSAYRITQEDGLWKWCGEAG